MMRAESWGGASLTRRRRELRSLAAAAGGMHELIVESSFVVWEKVHAAYWEAVRRGDEPSLEAFLVAAEPGIGRELWRRYRERSAQRELRQSLELLESPADAEGADG